MFDIPNENVSDLLDILYTQKVVYDSTGLKQGCELNSDYYYEEICEGISNVADDMQICYLDDYCEDTCYKITFDNMPEYFRLCKKLAQCKGISYKKLSYYKNAVDFINRELNGMYNYCMDWLLFLPKKEVKKKKYSLFVMTSCDFTDLMGLFISFYDIRDFFLEAIEEIKSDVRSAENKMIKMPEIKEIRRAA